MGLNQYLVPVTHLLHHPKSQQQVPRPALEPKGVRVTHHDAFVHGPDIVGQFYHYHQ